MLVDTKRMLRNMYNGDSDKMNYLSPQVVSVLGNIHTQNRIDFIVD